MTVLKITLMIKKLKKERGKMKWRTITNKGMGKAMDRRREERSKKWKE